MALRSLFSGISGLQTHQVRLDVISNNIANVNTTGFKASRVRFADVLSQTTEIAAAPESGRGGQNPVQVGLGVTGASITRDHRQGSVELTGRSTDLAIQGNGFFIVRDGETPAEFYTRDGSFEIDANGDLVRSANGFRVQGWNSTFDTAAQEFTIDTSLPVDDINVDLFQQFEATATSEVEFSGNLDSRAETALDPIRVSWTKNGLTREVEVRFTHVDPARRLFLYRVFNPNVISSTTGDFTQITTDAAGVEASGIIQLNDQGQVVRHFVNTADDDTTDPATTFLNLTSTTEAPSAPDIWAVARPASSFNGFDFLVFDTEGDGNNFVSERNASVSSIASDATARTITLTAANAPFSSQAGLTGSAFPTNGFATDAVLQVGTDFESGAPVTAGNGIGVPVQFVRARSNLVLTKRGTNAAGTRTVAQLPDDLVIGTNLRNPTANGTLAVGPFSPTTPTTTGTDEDSIEVFIDGRQYTRVANVAAFTPGSAQFVLDAENGIVEVNGLVAAGVNIVVNYDHEIRPTSTYTVAVGTTVNTAFGAAPNIGTGTAGANATVTRTLNGVPDNGDGSVFYKPGSATSMSLTDVSAGVTETFTEIPFRDSTGAATVPAANQFSINPDTGAITFGTFSSGAAVATGAGGDTIQSFSFAAYRRTGDNVDGAGARVIATTAGAFGVDNNAHGELDRWRLLSIPTGGAEAGQARLYLQGDLYRADFAGDGDGIIDAGAELTNLAPTATTISFLPTLGTTTSGTVRAELNYESDDRVNLIIPNGLTKTPNVNPLTDLTPETFAFAPNITQVTGNAGNNNQADSGDSVSVDVKPSGDFQYTTAVQVFDSLGRAWNLSLRFERLDTNLWLVSAIDPTDATGQRIAGYRLLAFDANGQFSTANTIPFRSPAAAGTSSSTFTGFYFDPPQVGGAPPPAEGANPLRITPDFAGLVQRATNSDAVVSTQNGAPPGDLESFSFNSEGFLVALFDNGRTRNIARVALQNFVNPAGLVSVGENMFRETLNSGRVGSPSRPGFDGVGSIIPGALEASNVDLSVEFVDLIITQRGFQAQSRSITTADQVLQEVLSLKR